MFASKSPKRVAEKQLNQAQLDLLEVSSTLESYQSNKRTLEERIARLKSYLAQDDAEDRVKDERTPVQRVRDAARLSSLSDPAGVAALG